MCKCKDEKYLWLFVYHCTYHCIAKKNSNNAHFKLMCESDSATLNSICIFHLKHIIPLLAVGSWFLSVNSSCLLKCDLWTRVGPHGLRKMTSSARDNQSTMYLWCFFGSVPWPQTWICAISKSSVFNMQSQPASWTGLEISSSTQRIGSTVCGLAPG